MKPRDWIVPLLVGYSCFVTGCGPTEHSSEVAGAGHQEDAEVSAVTFKEGSGLKLSPAVVAALGLGLVEAEERTLVPEQGLAAQVFAVKPRVLASARVRPDQSEALAKSGFVGAELIRVDRAAAEASPFVELVVAINQPNAAMVGDFIRLSPAGAPAPVLAVPRPAILESATGTFVYVVNGEAYLRSPVKVGVRARDYVEISDGLYPGDRVVAASVDQLWLAELRLTKGGGHSH